MMRLMGPAKRRPARCMAAVGTDKSHSPTSWATPSLIAQTISTHMAALTSAQMMVAAPVVAKAGAASKAKAE